MEICQTLSSPSIAEATNESLTPLPFPLYPALYLNPPLSLKHTTTTLPIYDISVIAQVMALLTEGGTRIVQKITV